jgi:hypothetical protein
LGNTELNLVELLKPLKRGSGDLSGDLSMEIRDKLDEEVEVILTDSL